MHLISLLLRIGVNNFQVSMLFIAIIWQPAKSPASTLFILNVQ